MKQIPVDIKPEQRIHVYWNSHKKCFSIRDAKTLKVLAHVDTVTLRNVCFRVQPCGKKKGISNVNVYASGFLLNYNLIDGVEISYDADHFYVAQTGERVQYANIACFTDGKIFIS